MKELTIEQKAKRYDEAIERAKRLHSEPTGGTERIVCEQIFPELKESEDEKIRKAIIEFFELQDDNTTYSFIPKKDILAWLENQKTSEEALQYLRENHSPSKVSDFQAAMNIAVAKAYDKGYNDGLEKQGEQKIVDKIEQIYHCNGVREPKEATGVLKQLLDKENYVWSEEDKVKINRIVAFLENLNLEYLNVAGNDILLKDIEWLKSLKDRYTWKPSEEQMDALETAVSSLQSTALESLYQDLKKL